jgi:hypothetical protein
MLGLAAAPVLAEAARVYSFPSEIKIYQPCEVAEYADYVNYAEIRKLMDYRAGLTIELIMKQVYEGAL